jgi:cobalt/nickel transport system permease protein
VEKVLFVLVTMGISLVANSIPVSLAIILLMAGGVIFKARIPCSFYFKLLAIPLSFLLVGTITIIISIARDSSGFLWYLQLGEFGLGLKAKDIIVALNIFLNK